MSPKTALVGLDCRATFSGGRSVSTAGRHRAIGVLLISVLVLGAEGCSIRRWAAGKLGDALASGGTTYANDDDPELVGDALPFALKTIEGLLESTPRHRG